MTTANVEHLAILACLRQGDMAQLQRMANLAKVYDREAFFALAEAERTGKAPDPKAMDIEFPGFSSPETTEPAAFYIQRVIDAQRRVAMQEWLESGRQLLSGSPTADEIAKFYQSAPEQDSSSGSLQDWGDGRVEAYLASRRKSDIVCDWPWPTMTRALGPLRKGEFIPLVGRLKMGKTFLGLEISYAAWKAGRDVLVLSGEMAIERMKSRLDSIDARVDARRFQDGGLNIREMTRYLRALRRRSRAPNRIWMPEHIFYSMADVQAAIASSKAQFVFLDGAYLFDEGAKGRSLVERMVVLAHSCKRISRKFGICLLATFQENREAEGKASGGVASVAWSDAVMQDADSGVEVSSEARTSPFRTLRALVARESSTLGAQCVIHYKPTPNCNFSEQTDWLTPTAVGDYVQGVGQ